MVKYVSNCTESLFHENLVKDIQHVVDKQIHPTHKNYISCVLTLSQKSNASQLTVKKASRLNNLQDQHVTIKIEP